MGVCCVVHSVCDANLSEALADPPLVWRIVEPEDDISYLRALENNAKLPFLARLLGRTAPAPAPRQLTFGEGELRQADLDKSWDGLRACLKICAPQATDFFEGAEPVGKIEVGYGPALFHMSDAVSRIAAAYQGLTASDILAAYRQVDGKSLYPRGLWQKENAEIESYLSDNFIALQAFLQHVQTHRLGVVIQLT